MKPRICSLLLLAVSMALSAPVFAQTYYVTDGDANIVWIIDLASGTATSFNTDPLDSPYALGITDTIVLSDRDNVEVREYLLDGTPTGMTWVGPGGFDEMLDGTTDGQGTYYGASWSGAGVTVSDEGWTNTTQLFDPGWNVMGIAYDTSDDTLWLVNDEAGTVHHYTLGGSEVFSFDPALPDRECCLAYDADTDTLWMTSNENDTVYNFAKDGTLLDSITIANYSPSNNWGGELGAAAAPSVPVPGLGTWGLVLLTAAMFGVVIARRKYLQA